MLVFSAALALFAMSYHEEQRLFGLLPVRMMIEVDESHLCLRLSGPLAPFSRTIALTDIEDVRLQEQLVMRPFGTWGLLAGVGVKVAPVLGRVYNFGHDRGVSVGLNNGNRLVIGSREPEQLSAALAGAV